MLVIIGTIVQYGEIMYTTFYLFGILRSETVVFGLPIIRVLLTNLRSVFYLSGFLVAMSRSRLP